MLATKAKNEKEKRLETYRARSALSVAACGGAIFFKILPWIQRPSHFRADLLRAHALKSNNGE